MTNEYVDTHRETEQTKLIREQSKEGEPKSAQE